jgi:iron(III) transport system ATP-binding protein
MSQPALTLERVSRRYGDRLAVAKADLVLRAGRVTCLLGPSGCGKSTLLRLVAGLEPIDEGRIEMNGAVISAPDGHIPPERRGVGLVFQDFALFPHLNVSENIGFGLRDRPAPARRAQVQTLLRRFQLEALAESWPHTLSGGEQQRVAIARALAPEPAVLLLDEPFSGLDGHLKAAVRRSMLAELRSAGTAVLIVTHDPEEAMLMGDELALMAGGQILQIGTPEECYRRPVSPGAARLLGETVIVPASVLDGRARTAYGDVPAPGVADGEASVIARPDSFRIGDDGADARIVDIRFSGSFDVVTLETASDLLSIRRTGVRPQIGEQTRVSLDAERATVASTPGR